MKKYYGADGLLYDGYSGWYDIKGRPVDGQDGPHQDAGPVVALKESTIPIVGVTWKFADGIVWHFSEDAMWDRLQLEKGKRYELKFSEIDFLEYYLRRSFRNSMSFQSPGIRHENE